MLRFTGRLVKSGRWWAVEVPLLGIFTQGRTKKDAYGMAADAIECLVNRKGFKVQVFPGDSNYFEVGSDTVAPLVARFLQHQRHEAGLTLVEVARRLGSASPNAYARYEQGRCVPSMAQLSKLISVLNDGRGVVIDMPRS